MSKRFEIVHEADVDFTPEEVWDGFVNGMSGWLWPSEFEPREGGAAAMGGTVTVWQPPHHFVTRIDGEDGWFNQLEQVIEGRDGGRTHYRYVHSGVMVEDWENQYDGAAKHTDFYQHTFRQYLTYFRGRQAVFAEAHGPQASQGADGFTRLREALGLAGAHQNDRVKVSLPGLGEQEAIVDFSNENFLGLRTDEAMFRFFGRNAFGQPVGLTVHHFDPGTDQQATQEAWQTWLNGIYQ